MEISSIPEDKWWAILTLPAILGSQNLFTIFLFSFLSFLATAFLSWAFSSGGPAWKDGRNRLGKIPIPGPIGLPVFGSLLTLSRGLAHRSLTCMASRRGATQLMAFSLGSTPHVVASEPQTAREILTSPHFANRPIKKSAKQLMFSRAIGFAPNGAYWRLLRNISSSHLFSPRRILAHESGRQLECAAMVEAISKEQSENGFVGIRKHLQAASLNNIMEIVFGKRYEVSPLGEEAVELNEMVREGFELLGAFNWSDHLPWLKYFYDPFHMEQRCSSLVVRVKKLVKNIIQEHKEGKKSSKMSDESDFVDVLLSLEGEEKLSEDDMVAVLWEMIFRGTDTSALLTEWIMAELVLNPNVQTKLRDELEATVRPTESITDADVARMPYLQAVVKETLRLHPPGPLLSWARLSTANVQLSNGMVIPADTVAMVNMWAITHDSAVWDEPWRFNPNRFMPTSDRFNLDVRGNDLRLAPFGAGRRVCPGKTLGMVTVSLWVAKLVRNFVWARDESRPVDLSEVLKLSCEMKNPLSAVVVPRAVKSVPAPAY